MAPQFGFLFLDSSTVEPRPQDKPDQGLTPLHVAARMGHAAVVEAGPLRGHALSSFQRQSFQFVPYILGVYIYRYDMYTVCVCIYTPTSIYLHVTAYVSAKGLPNGQRMLAATCSYMKHFPDTQSCVAKTRGTLSPSSFYRAWFEGCGLLTSCNCTGCKFVFLGLLHDVLSVPKSCRHTPVHCAVDFLLKAAFNGGAFKFGPCTSSNRRSWFQTNSARTNVAQ